MSDVVMLCEAYGEVKSCLYVAERSVRLNQRVTIIVFANHDLFRFFKEVNDRVFDGKANLIHCDIFRRTGLEGSGIQTIFFHITEAIKTRKYYQQIYDKYLSTFNGAEVYFFTKYFNPYSYYLLKKLRKNNRLVFMCVLDYGSKIKKYRPRSLYDLLSMIKLKTIYGFGMTIADLPHAKFPCMPNEFIAHDTNKVIGLEETEELLRDFDWDEFKISNIDNYSVIYFDQPLIDSGRISDPEVFKQELNSIFAILSKHFPDQEIAVKYHPAHHTDKAFIKTGEVLDDYIPAEFLYNPNIKMYLSFSSGSLANVEQGLAVSLIDLISFKDNQAKEFIRENLIRRSRTEILFPKSLREFERILIKAKGLKRKDS